MSEGPRKERPVVPSGGVSRSPSEYNPLIADADAPQDREIKRKREDARGKIAYWLLGLLSAQILLLVGAIFLPDEQWVRAEEYLQIAISGTFGLVGTVVGFYFGSQR